ncbi:MAG: hypothetical protein H7Y17_14410 [Chlorobia bacterium]|nr:hypothetical protein [Fimbriimonadaceae bacterium]
MKKILFAFFAVASIAGCGVGDVPPGMSNDDAKAAIAKMPPEQKIKAIANSPMPGPLKEKEYAKIEAETGVKAKDVLAGSGPGIPGASQ